MQMRIRNHRQQQILPCIARTASTIHFDLRRPFSLRLWLRIGSSGSWPLLHSGAAALAAGAYLAKAPPMQPPKATESGSSQSPTAGYFTQGTVESAFASSYSSLKPGSGDLPRTFAPRLTQAAAARRGFCHHIAEPPRPWRILAVYLRYRVIRSGAP